MQCDLSGICCIPLSYHFHHMPCIHVEIADVMNRCHYIFFAVGDISFHIATRQCHAQPVHPSMTTFVSGHDLAMLLICV